MQRSLGSSRITSIREQDLTGIDDLLRGATSDAIAAIDWLRPHFVDADGVLHLDHVGWNTYHDGERW